MKIVLLNVEQAQSIYRSQMVRDFPESELKPFASVQGMMTRGLGGIGLVAYPARTDPPLPAGCCRPDAVLAGYPPDPL